MTNIDALIQAQVSVNALKPALNWDDASLGLSFPKLGFGKGIHLPYGTRTVQTHQTAGIET